MLQVCSCYKNTTAVVGITKIMLRIQEVIIRFVRTTLSQMAYLRTMKPKLKNITPVAEIISDTLHAGGPTPNYRN